MSFYALTRRTNGKVDPLWTVVLRCSEETAEACRRLGYKNGKDTHVNQVDIPDRGQETRFIAQQVNSFFQVNPDHEGVIPLPNLSEEIGLYELRRY